MFRNWAELRTKIAVHNSSKLPNLYLHEFLNGMIIQKIVHAIRNTKAAEVDW